MSALCSRSVSVNPSAYGKAKRTKCNNYKEIDVIKARVIIALIDVGILLFRWTF